MDAKKCDRCGNFYQQEDWRHGDIIVKKKRKEITGVIFGDIYFIDDDIDLCPECLAFIKNWLTNKEN